MRKLPLTVIAPFAWMCVLAHAGAGQLVLEPTFCSCSVEFGVEEPIDGLKLECRKAGDVERETGNVEWAFKPISKMYRASVRDLDEDTEYEVRLVDGNGACVKAARFRTWSSEVPVAKTVVLTADGPLPKTISDKGTADGWIRYTAAPGSVLDFGEGEEDALRLDGAQFVLFDGLTIRGTRGRRVFAMQNCRNVRIQNCDISRWGRTGTPRFDWAGRNYAPGMSEKDYGINFDAAIEIGAGCFGVVVERCFIHDPRGRANSWRYSHPAGPEAVLLAKPVGSTVIRWNDFIGSDTHRFNDAVEGIGNFQPDGGFNRSADVYGNFMAFCNDDCIELDGGQRNVRCFGNRFEAALCGVSVQGCMVGPSYVYRNLFSGMCGEFGEWGQTVKTGSGRHGPEAEVSLEDNLFWGDGYGIEMRTNLTVRSNGNRFCGRQRINRRKASPASSSRGDAFKVEIAEAELPCEIPERPLPFVLDGARFSDFKVRGGVARPAKIVVKARGGKEDCAFRIVKNDDFDWLEVSPSEGVAPADGEVALTVRLDPAKMKGRRHYRGAFLARTADGFSRPFTVYAETDFVNPFHAEGPDDTAVFVDGFKEGEFVAVPDEERTFAFDIPSEGRWYLLLHGTGTGEVLAAVDADPLEISLQQGRDDPTWTMLAPGRGQGNRIRPYDLAAGRHRLTLKGRGGAFRCDGAVVTDNPLPFEPDTPPAVPEPAEVARRIVGQFLSTPPDAYQPEGMTRHSYVYGNGEHVHYSVVSLWVTALECARLSGDSGLEKRLTGAYYDLVRRNPGVFHDIKHVDYEVTGALPLEVAILTGDREAARRGLWYADRQWEKPTAGDNNLKQVQPLEKRMEWWKAGYSSETRLWLDDLYMMSLLQLKAYRLTGDAKYLDRIAREMALYLERLPRRGALFFHSPEAPYVWARGNGWMAAAMAMVLRELGEDHPCRTRILAEYRAMMAELLRLQRKSGLWGQLVDDAESWDETSGSAMFAYAIAEGVRCGWLGAEYAGARDRAYVALVSRLDERANLSDVCVGTGARDNREWYLGRARINGDPHGQAPLLWLCRVMIETENPVGRKEYGR